MATGSMESKTGDFSESGAPGSPPRENSEPSRVLDTEMRGSVMMELIVDKLKLLHYEREFCNSRSPPWPRLHKFYFALPSSNRNEQFLYFSTMVAWLFSFLGCQFAPPSEVDDPNVTCSKIMMELMSLGFAPPNWPPARLKQGYGDAVCSVLDALCSLVLDEIKYKFTPVTHVRQEDPVDDGGADNDNNNPSELYIPEEDCDEEEEDAPRVHTTTVSALETLKPTENETLKWKLDLERIAPQLRVVVPAEANDWRAHLDRAKQLYKETFRSFETGKPLFQKFEEEVTATLEKLETHENFVNQELEPLIAEFVAVKGRQSELEEKQKEKKEAVTKLESEDAKVVEWLEQVKQKMVEKGNEIADLSPLMLMKAAMQRLKTEVRDMEVQVGVLQHSLVRMQAKRALEDANA